MRNWYAWPWRRSCCAMTTSGTGCAPRPHEWGTAIVADKGFTGDDFEEFLAGLDLALIRPARKDDKNPGHFPNWLRQRVEAIIWTLKNQLGLERHGRVPAGLWARIIQRLLALNAVIWHNWAIGAPVKRSLIAYDQGAAHNSRSTI